MAEHYDIDPWPYVHIARQIIQWQGPRPENPANAAEGMDRALDAEAEEPTDYMARVIDDTPRLMTEDRQVFDAVQQLINLRPARGKDLPDWLRAISDDMAAGKLQRPPAKRGRPPGIWGVRDPGAQLAIAMNVHLVKQQMERDGHSIPTYVNEGNRDNTVAAIVTRALQDEGMRGVSIDSVVHAYQQYKKQITAQDR